MSYDIDFRSEAEKDIQEAYDWYQSHQPGLGDNFLFLVEESLNQLSQYPRASPIVYRDIGVTYWSASPTVFSTSSKPIGS